MGDGDDLAKRDREEVADTAMAAAKTLVGTLLGGILGMATTGDPGMGLAAATLAATGVEGGATALGHLRRRLHEQADKEALVALAKRKPQLEENIAKLNATMPDDASIAADALAVVDLFLAAWKEATDRRMRELVENATVNAFDPEKYEQGITKVVFEKLGRLQYGDLRALRQLAHGKKLPGKGPGLDAFHVQNLLREQLAFSGYPDNSGAQASELGSRLLAFVEAEQSKDDRASPEDD